MWKRVWLGSVAAGLLAGLSALPARSQVGTLHFRFQTPASLRAAGGFHTVTWDDVPAGGLDPGLFSITWYYTRLADGADRRRITTEFHDDFSEGLRKNWRPEGPFDFDWRLARDRDRKDRRDVLRGPAQSGPCMSLKSVSGDAVVSVLVRPEGLRSEFGIGVRMQSENRGFELRSEGNLVRLFRSREELEPAQTIRNLTPGAWYWYELGIRSVKDEVTLRVRIYDEQRERVIASFSRDCRARARALQTGGVVALWGPADFAEVYIDPWETRWVDDSRNRLRWNTADVPPGRYFLAAELSSGKRAPRLLVSEYQVEVDGAGRTETE